MPNIVNELTVREYSESFVQSDGLILCTWAGLDMPLNEELRGKVAEKGAQLKVVRSSLARRVLAEKGIEFSDENMVGNLAVVWGDAEQTIGAAKVLTDKAVKKTGKVQIRGGVLEGKQLSAGEAALLADVPDRDTLNAQMLGVIQGPARALASIINAVPSSVARVLQARVDEGGGDDA